MRSILLFFVPLLLLAAKCGTEKFALNEPLTLAPGQMAVCSDCDDLGVMFMAVTEDSRCPKNVNCIQAGQAKVVVGVGRDMDNAKELTFTLSGDPKSQRDKQRMDGYTIQALVLDPYPEDGVARQAENYRLQLIVSKDGTGGTDR